MTLPVPPMPTGGEKLGAWWDEAAAQKACAFFPTFLRHTEGEWAGRPFVLADWQRDRIIRPVFGWKRADGSRLIRIVWIEVPRKNGKGLSLDTPIPTPNGWTTMGQLSVGDRIFDDAGKPCTVTYTSPVHADLRCWRLQFSDGSSIVADEQHLWETDCRWRPWKPGAPKGDMRRHVVTTPQIAASVKIPRHDQNEYNHRLPPIAALHLEEAECPIAPYVLGYWLGNGHSAHARVFCAVDDAAAVSEAIRGASGYRVAAIPDGPGCTALTLAGNNMIPALRRLDVLKNKHIPATYLRASLAQRGELLQGLLDSDGTVGRNGGQVPRVYYTSTNHQLALDVLELICSLGFKATIREDIATIKGREIGPAWEVAFHGTSETKLFRLSRKQDLLPPPATRPTRSSSRHIVACEEISTVPTRCIQVDSPSHLFLAGRGMVATHNTELAAGTGLALMFVDGEIGGQGYSMAVNKKQAEIVWRKASTMVGLSEPLGKCLEPFATSIYCPALHTSFKPLSEGPHGKHGLSASFAIGDEVHEWRDGELADVVHKSTASRRQPLEIYITTAGVAGSGYASEMHELALQIIAGEVEDPTFLPVIFAAPEEADWKDEATWRAANPNYGVSVKPEYMRTEAEKAARSPRLENDFRRYHLNQWTEQSTRWLPMDSWKLCTADPSNPTLWKQLGERLAGRPCFGGLDLSITKDITSLCWVFPPEDEERERWAFLWRFWLPEDTVHDQPLPRRARYLSFRDAGALTLTSGNVVDYNFIRADIVKDAEIFRPQWLGIDRFNASHLAQQLKDEDGIPVEWFGQGYLSMSSPSKGFERLILGRLLEHGNNPVATWMARNAAVETDAAGNIKPTKAKAADKIDGIVAAIMGYGGSIASGDDSPYADGRGLLVI